MAFGKNHFATVLDEALSKKWPAFLSASNLDIAFQSRVLGTGRETVTIKNTVPLHFIRPFVLSQNFTLQLGMVRWSSSAISGDGRDFFFPIGQASMIQETRSQQRTAIGQGENIFCEILNPFDRETVLRRIVLDVSETGLSIVSPRVSRLFEPGVTFPHVHVLKSSTIIDQGNATCIYTRKLLGEDGTMRFQVGLKFER